MSSKRRMFYAVFTALALLCAGGAAFAEEPIQPYLSVWSAVHVNLVEKTVGGKTVLTPDYSTAKLWGMNPRITSFTATKGGGTLTLTPKPNEAVKSQFYIDAKSFTDGVTWPFKFTGTEALTAGAQKIFDLSYENRGAGEIRQNIIRAGDLTRIAFDKDTVFSGMPFSYVNGTDALSGNFPEVFSYEELLNNCVPYIELELNSAKTKIVALRWRVIPGQDKPGEAVTTGETTYHVGMMGDREVSYVNSTGGLDGVDFAPQLDGSIQPGTLLSGDITLNLDVKKTFTALLAMGTGDHVSYGWYFDNPLLDASLATPREAGRDKYGDGNGNLPETVVTGIKGDLGNNTVEVLEAEDDSITTSIGNSVDYYGDKTRTSAVIAVKQKIADGGAVVFGEKLRLPVNAVSEAGVNLPRLADGANVDDLRGYYKVMKYFQKGGGIDLLDKFGAEIFTYDSAAKNVVITRPVVVVDDVRPKDNADVVPYGDNYGVRLTSNFLYVYDGVKDGLASDPIALEASPADDDSSGCSVTGAGLGVLALALFAIAKRRG